MKNGLLIWNVLLTIVAGYLLVMHFNPKKNNVATAGIIATDSSVNGKNFRIAYFEMDSVAANFDLVKQVKAELNKKEESINNEMDQLGKEFQEKYKYYQDKAQAGSLTQAQSESASQEIKSLDEKMRNRKQQLDQDYNDLMVRRQNDIKSKIETFLKEYNKSRNFSYIVSYEQGLFYYKDTAYNITADVIKGLNEFYKSGKK